LPHAEGGLNEVVWTARALADLRAIRAYIEQFNPSAAQHVGERLIETANKLANFSLRGRPVRGTAMRELVAVSPYITRYRLARGTVFVLRIRRSARRPTRP
jgi:addiction module RelE/StbE family toxin